MRLSVVIPTLGRPAALRRTLESIAAAGSSVHEVLVVDGDAEGSARPIVSELNARHPGMNLTYLSSERGASRQRNRGIEAAAGDVILFLDDDVLLEDGALEALLRVYDDRAVVGATGRVEQRFREFGNNRSWARRLLSPRGTDGTMTRFGYPRRIQDPSRARDVEFMQGCLMSARRDLAARLRFDETLGRPSGYALLEDEDFSYRLSQHGRVRHVPDAVAQHENLGFHSRDDRYFNRLVVTDRAYLLRKNFRPGALQWAQFVLLVLVFAVHRAVNGEWRGLVGIVEGSRDAWRERGRP